MSKGLRTAAQIVGMAVAVAAAIPTAGGSTLLAGALGVSAASASAIAAGVGVAISAASALTPRKPHGRPATFTAFVPETS